MTARRARHDLFTNCDNSLPIHARPIRVEMETDAALKSTAIGSLHAGVRCAMNQRGKLERLCRYIARPAIADERLARNQDGQVVLTLKTPYRDGTTHIVLSPLEFMQRLAALVPRPRLNLIRFHGALTPNAKLRAEIIPGEKKKQTSKRQ